MRGASALERLLGELPGADLRVLVVWEPVIATDIGPPVSSVLGLVPDGRVSQFWDPRRVLSADIVRAVDGDPAAYGFDGPLPAGFIAWDVALVFDRSVRWESRFPVPAYYGGPVERVVGPLREAVAGALARPAPPASERSPTAAQPAAAR